MRTVPIIVFADSSFERTWIGITCPFRVGFVVSVPQRQIKNTYFKGRSDPSLFSIPSPFSCSGRDRTAKGGLINPVRGQAQKYIPEIAVFIVYQIMAMRINERCTKFSFKCETANTT